MNLRWVKFFYLFVVLVFSIGATHARIPATLDGKPLPSLAPMLESVTPGVVNISTKAARYQGNLALERFFGLESDSRPNRPNSLGSGVIVDAERGLVVTNNHVIENAAEILVTLNDGRELLASVIGTDPKTDVALLKVAAENLTALKWANSDKLKVGDFCLAIGNPFGLGQTVTSGIVSALGRSGLGIEDLEDFIQTDASINPGNSGGALVNLRGELIGINTAIVGPSGGNVGIGFAIPANLALSIVEQLLEFGVVRRGMLGIAAKSMTPEMFRQIGLSRSHGVIIVKVERGSPAEKSGIQVGDIITSIDGEAVKTVESVINTLGLTPVGKKIQLRVIREGKEFDINTSVELFDEVSPLLTGASFEDAVTGEGREYVIITAIQPGSRLDAKGLQAGDIILSVNKIAVDTIADMRAITAQSPNAVLLLVQRGLDTRYIEIN